MNCRVLSVALATLTSSCGYLRDRGLDLADCFKANVGVGIGLAVDAKLTDYVSPGVGFASLTANAGWDDRRVYGVWRESDVINTPRIAYEAFFDDYRETASVGVAAGAHVANLALSSLNLPNERWLRHGEQVTVEYYSLFNFGDVGRSQRALTMTGHLLDPSDRARAVDKTTWQSGFFEVGVTAGVVHARVGWNPLETVDFLLGWFGLDVAHDDGARGTVRLVERNYPRVP